MSTLTPEQMRAKVVEIERVISRYVGNAIDSVSETGSDKVAAELAFSVAVLLMARSAAVIHVWTGEPLDLLRNRMLDAFDHDARASMEKITEELGNGGGPNV